MASRSIDTHQELPQIIGRFSKRWSEKLSEKEKDHWQYLTWENFEGEVHGELSPVSELELQTPV